ncbi:hypothetical protein [Variovorax sp. PAMC 28711]|uniref:hypothetical protein n=1 Tax=Variovorax sp. PAMC 28711 TaxID=1795631 RepID=UPI00078C8746|nr:hypothetical protein [Variovorax sp. PAMC 28711]AMM23176.1 hypothetical protein AX767_01395 [Variovorax sp. PAMC 28711]
MIDPKSPEGRYKQHKAGAAARGLAFTLSYAQWWELWEPHWEKRGRGSREMCMCRLHDEGGYTPGNVRIATNRENKHEQAMEAKVRHTPRRYSSQREYRQAPAQAMAWQSRGDVNVADTDDA